MPSMSYCMFENTQSELSQVIDAMDDADIWDDLKLNGYEKRAAANLFDLCQSYINNVHRLSTGEDLS
jgi:hypothetical protein